MEIEKPLLLQIVNCLLKQDDWINSEDISNYTDIGHPKVMTGLDQLNTTYPNTFIIREYQVSSSVVISEANRKYVRDTVVNDLKPVKIPAHSTLLMRKFKKSIKAASNNPTISVIIGGIIVAIASIVLAKIFR